MLAQSESEGTLDAVEAGIFDLATGTEWALRYGSEAAMTVLRVDAVRRMCLTILSMLKDAADHHEQGFGRGRTSTESELGRSLPLRHAGRTDPTAQDED